MKNLETLIKKADITLLTEGKNAGNLWIRNTSISKSDIEEIKANKADIITYLQEKAAEEKAKSEDRRNRINSIEGLKEIENAKNEIENWNTRLYRSFDGENGGGIGCGQRPEYDMEALYAKYPRATAYLNAEEMSLSHNFEIAKIGKEALEEVIYGNYTKAIEIMENGKQALVKEHIYD